MLHPTPSDPPNDQDRVDARAQRQQPELPAPDVDPSWRAGRKLAEARRQRGWSVDEVAERIRVRRDYLVALEEMNPKLLPGKAYTLAFLRSYAKELGIDEQAIVDQFRDELALTRDDGTRQIREPASRPQRDRPWRAAVALVAVAVLFVGWRALTQNPSDAPAETAAVTAPSPAGPSPAQTGTEAHVVEVRALAAAWLEARGPDGTVFLSTTLQPGQVYRPDPSPGWTLHARDGGAFELFVNGQSAGLLGTTGMPVLGRSIDEIQPVTQAEIAAPRS